MKNRRILAAIACLGILAGATPAAAASDTIRDLAGKEKRAFFSSVGWHGSLECQWVGVSVSNRNWAIAAPTNECGENSGHSQIYRRTASGKWKYLFYDMENDGCTRFHMPSAVRDDFRGYVC